MWLISELLGKAPAHGRITESRRWLRAGLEPSTMALLSDPIALLLLRADRLNSRDVEAAMRTAKRRRVVRGAKRRIDNTSAFRSDSPSA